MVNKNKYGGFSFIPSRYERIDKPHHTAHGDPFDGDDSFHSIFRYKKWVMKFMDILPFAGLGSYYPHLFIPIIAEFFFRSWLIVSLGVFAWTMLIELPIFLIRKYFNLLPSGRSLWDVNVVYERKTPSEDQINEAFKIKSDRELPSMGIYYAVITRRKRRLLPPKWHRSLFDRDVDIQNEWMSHERRENHFVEYENDDYDDNEDIEITRRRIKKRGGNINRKILSEHKEVYCIEYKRIGITEYIITAILIDILVGLGGVILGSYIRTSFQLGPFREHIDNALFWEFFGMFILSSYLSTVMSWILGPISMGYIFLVGFMNGPMHRDYSPNGSDGWTPYIVLFSITLYFWIIFFKNPFVCLQWISGENNNNNNNSTNESSVVASDHLRKNMIDKSEEISVSHDSMLPKEVLRDINTETSPHKIWWFFVASNYNFKGYNAWFGSMFLFIIVAIVGLSL